jgi:hypothetical protein
MTGGFEAAGDIASGALFGRAIEPRAGEDGGMAHGHGLCLNCGTALTGDFCHACGQSGHVHNSIASIGHDLLHGAFHFEGKIWRTIPMLVLHPGKLTRRYIAGERARFVSPLALFLFFVFLMFATIHTFGGDLPEDPGLTPQQQHKAAAKIDAQISAANARLTQIEARHKADRKDRPAPEVVEARTTVNTLRTMRNLVARGDHGFTVSDRLTGWAPLDRGIIKANANPSLALYKLESSAYKYSWALIPISLPFVALLFLWRRRFKLYDHAIFVTYSLSFMMLGVTFLIAAGNAGLGAAPISLLAIFVPPVHMFAQLRGAYSLGKFSAFWRTIALSVFSLVAFILFAALLFGLGLME